MPDWTDANLHDPGVTLPQLLVWALFGGLVASTGAAYLRRRRRGRVTLP